jgi:LmbE family N-acetylglucosaminyl deacetylase
MSTPLRILILGAHPDDCDMKAGGTAALYRALGHEVRFVSVTNGESGHQQMYGPTLTARRTEEAARAGRLIGVQYDVLEFRDGGLQPTLEARYRIIRLIREFNPDLVLTHRPNDYHPDHRYTSQIVCDAAYMVCVPAVVPSVPPMRKNPVMGFLSDHFQRPYPFSPTVVVDIEPVIDTVIDMIDCHESQFYEWMPWIGFFDAPMPTGLLERKQFLREKILAWIAPLADRHRDLIIETYGEERGRKIRYIEAFEPCEYGSPLDDAARKRLFPMVPWKD